MMADNPPFVSTLKDLRSRGFLRKRQYDGRGNVDEAPFSLPKPSPSRSSSANPTPADPATPKRRRGEIEIEGKMNKDGEAGMEQKQPPQRQQRHERSKRSKGFQGVRGGGRRQSGQKELLLWNGKLWPVEYKSEVAAGSKFCFADGSCTVIDTEELSARIRPCHKATLEGMGQ